MSNSPTAKLGGNYGVALEEPAQSSLQNPFHALPAILLLTPLVFLINGYHPYADDGGIYVAEIKRLIHPALYWHDAVFVSAPARESIFGHVVAALVSHLHLPLPPVLLACQLASIFLFLLSSAKVAEKLFAGQRSRWGALLAAAVCFTLPVAGTALFVMDPYVTARSFSTPVCLFALAASLDGAPVKAVLWLILAALLHPLMAAYAAILILMLELASRSPAGSRIRNMAGLALTGFLLSAVIFAATGGISPRLASSQAVLSRSYFFLSEWQWYQWLGVVFPLLLLLLGAWRAQMKTKAGMLAAAAFAVGGCALAASSCFVHRDGSFLLARLQVLRSFHILYVAGILLAGGWAAGRLDRIPRWRIPIATLACFGISLAMFAAQRATYSNSDPIGWPWLQPRNPWEQAFLWIRANTPRNALFALDADYIQYPGEDAQNFRAVAERSTLADWYKDGGIASEFPAAHRQWWLEVQKTEGLDRATDQERLARLLPLGANWIVLPVSSPTGFSCPYQNRAVRVCRLPSSPLGARLSGH